ncbi:MAG TPA: glycerol kinase GlpK [Pseudonocardiaceae bacterium]|nr:glycerol kinase GlpK [Pseudonocardiaceae bacterium]
MSQYVAAIDQGTTSTRCMIFNHAGRVVSADQREHQQYFPAAGWVEHDPLEIWANTCQVTAGALARAGLAAGDIAAVGITNQRETTVVWDRRSGEPVYRAIVWQDTRTDRLCAELGGSTGAGRYRARTGLPLSTYFAGPKIRWILDHIDGARQRARDGELCFGTIDSWLLWNMTGGLHVTDVTNASRTLLMDLQTLCWDREIAEEMGVPIPMLAPIRSSSQVYGEVREPAVLAGVPIAGILGDQQAATFGQACLSPGEAKNTYGTGNFMLLNTGTQPVPSRHGLLTTVCYQLGSHNAVYALEGSIAVTGALVQWLRDNLGLISSAAEIEQLAGTVDDNGGAYFVPAFSGLFAPHWRSDARGAIVGLTRYVNRGHLARAVLEATAFQTREVVDAMNADSGADLTVLKVDGGMVGNELLMQFQADVLGVPVIRPVVSETTALGAAYASGLAVGLWSGEAEIRQHWAADRQWDPEMDAPRREQLYAQWRKAVIRTLDWVDD